MPKILIEDQEYPLFNNHLTRKLEVGHLPESEFSVDAAGLTIPVVSMQVVILSNGSEFFRGIIKSVKPIDESSAAYKIFCIDEPETHTDFVS